MKTVLALIVTYNRCNDLRCCISALRSQSCQDFDILVVNNGSTDGTKDYLDSEEGITVIHQSNVGGAGGFYTGMKYMYDNSYEWLWMMDDDGVPDSEQLKELLKQGELTGNKFLNALVLDKDNHRQYSFNVGIKEPVDKVTLQDLIAYKIAPFNGTFIHREVISKAGMIKKEMFIWGDEQELKRRYIANGFIPYTVTSAIHYHPKEKGKKDSLLPFLPMPVLVKPEKMSHYYYRNIGFINKTYGNWISVLKPVVKYTIYFLGRGKMKELKKFYKFYRKGINNDYDI